MALIPFTRLDNQSRWKLAQALRVTAKIETVEAVKSVDRTAQRDMNVDVIRATPLTNGRRKKLQAKIPGQCFFFCGKGHIPADRQFPKKGQTHLLNHRKNTFVAYITEIDEEGPSEADKAINEYR